MTTLYYSHPWENEVQKTAMFVRFRTPKKVDLQASKKRYKSFKSKEVCHRSQVSLKAIMLIKKHKG
jgi:hypothetical protein